MPYAVAVPVVRAGRRDPDKPRAATELLRAMASWRRTRRRLPRATHGSRVPIEVLTRPSADAVGTCSVPSPTQQRYSYRNLSGLDSRLAGRRTAHGRADVAAECMGAQGLYMSGQVHSSTLPSSLVVSYPDGRMGAHASSACQRLSAACPVPAAWRLARACRVLRRRRRRPPRLWRFSASAGRGTGQQPSAVPGDG
jgi:hypothetical protein